MSFAPHTRALILAMLASTVLSAAVAIEADQVPLAKRSSSGLHLTAVEAAAMKQQNPGKVLFIDIRTRAEAIYVGLASPASTTSAAAPAEPLSLRAAPPSSGKPPTARP